MGPASIFCFASFWVSIVPSQKPISNTLKNREGKQVVSQKPPFFRDELRTVRFRGRIYVKFQGGEN